MQFDALTLAAVTDEIRSSLLGGRVQRVLLTSPLSIGLEVYANRQRWQLLASAHPQYARVHLVRGKLSRGVEHATPLLLLLRKYVLGGRIVAVEQPALERILIISIAKERESRNRLEAPSSDDIDTLAPAEDEGEETTLDDLDNLDENDLLRCELIIEPMERRSNIILVDDNNIVLECVKRVTGRMSRRVIVPRAVYEVPPVQANKRDPRTATAAGIESLLQNGDQEVARALVNAYRGVSPQIGREVAQRALGDPVARLQPDLSWYTLAARLRELWTTESEPSLVPGDDEPLAYAPYVLTQYPNAEPQESMSAALEAFYNARESFTAHRQRRDAVAHQLQTARDRLVRQRDQLTAELERAKELERLRWEGEMIFAYLHEIKPRQASLVVEGQTIELDPLRSAVEAAQQRFRAYDKAKSALSGLPERLDAVNAQLNGLEEVTTLLTLADSYEQIEQIAAEAVEGGYIHEPSDPKQRRKPKIAKVKPLNLVSSDGFDIYVGRSTNQNVEVTFRIARNDDWWLHVRNIPGAHVIVRTEGRAVPESTLREAAGLAAYFSPMREEGSAEVELARRSTVRRIPHGPPSLVNYRAERTLRVKPLPPW